ncbi:Kinesin light chain 3 [Borealophlyctis nickersoniae]|nr:Kinesin light chain 3 [Borealophlyctis nickersoniae]
MLSTDLQLRQKTSCSDHQVDGFSLLGVRLSYFDTFIDEWCGGRDILDGWTTTDVCDKVVKPLTETSKKSVCDHLVEMDSLAVGRATCFISHAWQYEFLDVVDAVKHRFHKSSTADVIVWFDLFSISQHQVAEHPFTWWTGTFMKAIRELGSVLMILHPFNNPIALGRAWCVFELYACIDTKSHFAIALPPRDTPAFPTALRDNPGVLYDMLGTIKSDNSVAFIERDRQAIHDAIREKVGFDALDRMVLSRLSIWMVSTLRSHILLMEKAGNEVEHATWLSGLARLSAVAERLCVDSLERCRRELGEDHPDTLSSFSNFVSSISNLAELYKNQGKYEKAEPLYVDCLDRSRRVLGWDHPDTLSDLHNLAVLYDSQQKYEEAEPLFLECVEISRRVLGEDHPNTLSLINNLAGLYEKQGEYEKAEPLYVDCLERRSRVLGEDHPDTVSSRNNLAVLYENQRKYEEVDRLNADCLESMKRVLGQDHPDTLSFSNRAPVCGMSGKTECGMSEVGGDHPDTQTVRGLASRGGRDIAEMKGMLKSLGFNIWNLFFTQFQSKSYFDELGRTEMSERGTFGSVDLRCYDATIRNRNATRDVGTIL